MAIHPNSMGLQELKSFLFRFLNVVADGSRTLTTRVATHKDQFMLALLRSTAPDAVGRLFRGGDFLRESPKPSPLKRRATTSAPPVMRKRPCHRGFQQSQIASRYFDVSDSRSCDGARATIRHTRGGHYSAARLAFGLFSTSVGSQRSTRLTERAMHET